MDPSKIRDTLFRKYVQICELKLSEKDLVLEDASLKKMAMSLLDLYRQEPFERFKLFRFYDIVENSLKMLKTSSLSALLNAFGILETFCINLFLYPWKKEFKTIKTFTGHFVYYIKSALCEDDVWNILYFIGYHYEKETYQLKNKVNTNHVKFISFELFLAGIECENLLEIYSQIKVKGYSELNVVQERKNSADDVKGCIDAMKRQRRSVEGLHTSVAQMDFRRSDSERLTNSFVKHLTYKPSPVDSDEIYLEKQLNKVHLTPGHRKKEAVYGSFEDIADEIFRPTPSLLAMSSSPRGGSEEYLQSPNGSWRAETNLNTSFHALDDDLDLYTAEGPRSTSSQRWTEATSSYSTRQTKNNDIRAMYHETPRITKETTGISSTVALKCQMCGISSGTSSCQKCDSVLCNQCPCRHEYPRAVSILARSASVQNDLSPGSTPKEKCAYATTSQYQEHLLGSKSTSILRCGFCDKAGAKFTCVNCSKVSCNDCKIDYHLDLCSKNKYHSFFPNSQLNFKSSKNYTVYR